MNAWSMFSTVAATTLACWLPASVLLLFKRNNIAALALTLTGILLLAGQIIFLWLDLERPPLRTMGETRLWYSLFLAILGLILHRRWNYRWILPFSLFMASIFIMVNWMKPDIHSKELPAALQSRWFIPHVVTYMLSYAFLSMATIMALRELFIGARLHRFNSIRMASIDNLVYIGTGLFMAGLLMGAVWAKEAWGECWTWDPKETWAFITVATCLLYIHLRSNKPRTTRVCLWLVVLAFLFLLITWKGVQYLPNAANSLHSYSLD